MLGRLNRVFEGLSSVSFQAPFGRDFFQFLLVFSAVLVYDSEYSDFTGRGGVGYL
jgi:hypothetical protein